MKFKFEPDLQHQAAAIDAVVDLFAGQEEKQSLFTIAPKQVEGELEYNEKLLGYANRCDLLPEQILENLHIVQDRNALDSSLTLDVKGDKRSGEGDYEMDFPRQYTLSIPKLTLFTSWRLVSNSAAPTSRTSYARSLTEQMFCLSRISLPTL